MRPHQRKFTRVAVAVHAELRIGGNVVIHGKLRNISVNGLLLRCDAMLPDQSPCVVFLHLDGGQGGPNIEAQGLVVRSGLRSLAIQFIELVGQESAQHLRNLVLYNSGPHVDQVEKEFQSYAGLSPRV
jgi:hypothetical protein